MLSSEFDGKRVACKTANEYHEYLMTLATKSKPHLPQRLQELIRQTDCLSESTEAAKQLRLFLVFITLHKNAQRVGRKERKTNSGDRASLGTDDDGAQEVARTFPDAIYECASLMALFAVAVFCLRSKLYKEAHRKKLLEAVISGEFSSMEKVLELERVKTSEEAAAKAQPFEHKELVIHDSVVKVLLQASNMLADPALAKLAYAINREEYRKIIISESFCKRLRNAAPLRPGMSVYLKRCVSLDAQRSEEERLKNDIEINRTEAIQKINAALIKHHQGAGPRGAKQSQKQFVFADTQEYFVFEKGPLNFNNDLTVEITDKGVFCMYRRQYIYDVFALPAKDATEERKYTMIGPESTWQERLDMVPQGFSKITLRRCQGSALNKQVASMEESARLGLSWNDERGSHSEQPLFVKNKGVKRRLD